MKRGWSGEEIAVVNKHKWMEEVSGYPKWDELSADALGLIFQKLRLLELLTIIPCVCKSWREVVIGPYCWQEIKLTSWSFGDEEYGNRPSPSDDVIYRMLQLLISRSGGSPRELSVGFASDDCLLLIAKHAQCLQRLELPSCYVKDETFERAAPLLSNITSLDLDDGSFGPQAVQAIGKYCKSLTTFQRNVCGDADDDHNDEALAIASSMPHLKNLEINEFTIDMSSLVKILESCKHLERLNISYCEIKGWDAEVLKRYPKLKVEGLGSVDTPND